MAVDTVPTGYPTIPILATLHGDELYAFLKRVFNVELLDRQENAKGGLAYMSIRIGDSVISVMQSISSQQTCSALYVYVRAVDDV